MSKFTAEDIRLAQETEKIYGVPASVTLAQYALESGYGTTKLAKNANNYFGITGKNKKTGAFHMSGGRSWAKYSSKTESFYDHGRLLSTDLYASKTAGATTVSQYIDAIAETYAPSSDENSGYAAKLKQIINENNLTQYDGSAGTGGYWQPSQTVVSDTTEESGLIGKVVKFIVLLLVGVLAAVFFFSAFDVSLNPKKVAAKAVAKTVEKAGEE